MPRILLTDLVVQRLPPSTEYVTYYDEAMPAFGIRVGKFKRTWVLMRGTRRKRISLGRYPQVTLKEARQSARTLLYGREEISDDTSLLTKDVVAQFLEIQASRLRPATMRETRRALERTFLPRFHDSRLNSITTKQLTELIDSMAKRPAEANATHAKISAFFNWCARRQLIARNPLAGLAMPHKVTHRDRVLSDQELAAVYRTALQIHHTPYGALVLIILHTGLRRNEAYTLQWQNISRDTITIPKDISKNHTELVLPNTINGYLVSVPKTNPRLFPIPIHWERGQRLLQERSSTAEWTLHDLRRTLSTKMAEWDIAPPDVVEAILNHKTGSRSQIQRTYDRHNRLPQMRRALGLYADRLRALITPKLPPTS